MKIPYFKIKNAVEEAKDSFSYGSGTDKLSSSAKLFGKSVANIGIFAVKLGVEGVKRLPEKTGDLAQEMLDKNSDSMSEEQIEKAKRSVELGKEAKERRLQEEEREEREEREKRQQEQKG